MIDFKNVTAGTIARTLILILALINQLLSASGHAVLPIEDAQVETLVSTTWTVVAAMIAWWKNNSVTPAAIEADKIKANLKEGKSVTVVDGSAERRQNSI